MKKLPRKRIVVLGIAIAFLAVYIFSLTRTQRVEMSNFSERNLFLRGNGEPLLYSFEAGHRYRYSLSYKMSGTFNLAQLLNVTSSAKVDLTTPMLFDLSDSVLELTVLEKNGDGSTELSLQFPILVPRLMLGSRLANSEIELIKAFQAPNRVVIDPTGRVISLHFNNYMNAIGRNILRQIVFESFPRFETGTYQEPFLAGKRTVESRIECTSDLCILSRSIDDIVEQGKQVSYTLAGQLQYHIKEGLVTEAEGIRKTKAAYLNQGTSSSMSNDELRFSMKQIDIEAVGLLDIAKLKVWHDDSVAPLNGLHEFKLALMENYRKRIKDKSWSEEISNLKQIGEGTVLEHRDLYETLYAFLMVHPEYLDELPGLLEELNSDTFAFDVVGILLAKLDNPEAQLLLVEAISDHFNDPYAVKQLSFSMGLVENVNPLAARDFVDLVQSTPNTDPSYNQVLAMAGSVGYHSKDEALKDDVFALYSSKLERKGTENPFIGLSNLGHPKTPALVAPALKSDSYRIRQDAVFALRRVPDETSQERVTDIILNRSVKDESAAVRATAASALENREMLVEELNVIASRLREERSPLVVDKYLTALASQTERPQHVRIILEDYYRVCGHEQICKKVESLLLSLP